MLYRQHIALGALFIVASELMFATMGAAVKAATVSLPNEMAVFMRNFFGLLFVLPLLTGQRGVSMRTEVPHLHLLRALFGVSAMYCFFYVLEHLALAEAVILKMTAPFFMPLIALFWLGEQPRRLSILAVPVGFVGVALVLGPHGSLSWNALVGVLGGLLAALAKVTVRRLGRSEPSARVVFYFALFGVAFSSVPLLWSWRWPTPTEWGLLIFVGLMGTLGQLLLTRGYAVAEAGRVGPFTYFSVVFAAAYGYLFWGESPGLSLLSGATLIVFAGLLTLYARPAKSPKLAAQSDPSSA
jgi:drug/metabolite transporter (DMT)-like permease